MDTNSNKNRQNRTSSGLTPIQEQAAILMASGERITSIAERLQLNRSTIYEWMDVLTFQCFYNKQCENNKKKLKAGLFGLQKKAIEAIKESLESSDPSIKLKAATWLVERLSDTSIGETDPANIIKERCRVWGGYNEEKFSRLLEAYNLQEQEIDDYNDLPQDMPLTPTEKALLGMD